MNCRHCGTLLHHTFLDLGFAPPSNHYIGSAALNQPEIYFPLRLKVCDTCWLVQTEDYTSSDELFTADYAYFSSVSLSWLQHAKSYVEMATARFGLDRDSFVLEIASNDGYLLRNFIARQIPCLGVEPTHNTAEAAEKIGVPTLRKFFDAELGAHLAREGKQADLILGNNVYAHVPDINDFTIGLRNALKPQGSITLEFPHLLQLLRGVQFDTVYHEHFSYLSLYTVVRLFQKTGLRVYDVEKLSTHGGSLRIFGCHNEASFETSPAVQKVLLEESELGMRSLAAYLGFQNRVDKIKDDFLDFLVQTKRSGKKVAAYGAAAKGVTLLNYAGVKADLVPFVCDAASSKQGKFLPGCHIPIYPPQKLEEVRPDYVLILPWNISAEIKSQLTNAGGWEKLFVTAIPTIKIDIR